VAMMGDIYRQAEEVLVWLGDAQESDAAAFWMINFLHDFENRHEVNIYTAGLLHRAFSDQLSIAHGQLHCTCCHLSADHVPQILTAALKPLASFWRRPWFNPLWVLQEVVLASSSTYYCGSHSTSSTSVGAASSVHYSCVMRVGASEEEQQANEAVMHICHCVDRHGRRDLGNMLIETFRRECTEPRDQIYAIGSIVKSGSSAERDMLRPNYSISLHRLWTTVAMCWLSSNLSLFFNPNASDDRTLVLALPGLQCDADRRGLPSWTPNFGTLDDTASRKFDFYEALFSPKCWRKTGCFSNAV